MKVLLFNAGSSSLKCSLFESADRTLLARATVDWAGGSTRYERSGPNTKRISTELSLRRHADAVRHVLDDLHLTTSVGAERPAAVGHRIVHGGELTTPVQITPASRTRLAALAELAPLHNRVGLDALAAAETALPGVPHVAVFDTAFHATLPAAAVTYPVPDEWTTSWGIRRYGFHGLSHSYCAARAAQLVGRPLAELRLVVCHLGHGCSATAVRHGRSVDTTMGFTPLDGLMMATRSGAVDPGILLHVLRQRGLSASQVEDALAHGSGLLGVSGVSADMRQVLAASHRNDGRARLAVDIYVHRVRQAIGALAVTLGGVDALVFTAGVGEGSAEIRAATCRGLECLGLELDADANARCRPDADVARAGARARILVVASREDLVMLSAVTDVIST